MLNLRTEQSLFESVLNFFSISSLTRLDRESISMVAVGVFMGIPAVFMSSNRETFFGFVTAMRDAIMPPNEVPASMTSLSSSFLVNSRTLFAITVVFWYLMSERYGA